jgi:NTE family protein
MRVGLVLGSGAARGYTQIGVIDELTARGHQIVAISGASMGALVGGMYAAGKLEDFREFVLSLTRTDVLRLMDPSLGGGGFISGKRLFRVLRTMVGRTKIENLPIPYVAVATDLINRREVWFRDGELLPAIRASVSIPVFLTPARYQGMALVDGGVLNPLPVSAILGNHVDVTVAVSLLGPSKGDANGEIEEELEFESEAESEMSDELTTGLGGKITHLVGDLPSVLHAIPLIGGPHAEPKSTRSKSKAEHGLDVARVGMFTLDVMQAAVSQVRYGMNPADVLIEVPADIIGSLEFDQAERMINYGRELAVEAFDAHGL